MRLVFALFVVMGGTASGANAPEPPADKELAKLQGAWKMVSLERDGRVFEYPEGAQPHWLVKGDLVTYPGRDDAGATLTLYATNPKGLDLKRAEEKQAREAIYEIDGDIWTICVNPATEGVRERPTEFSTRDKPDWKIWVLKREKP
jgi:uncharacterized protein (TIGR03067 family)